MKQKRMSFATFLYLVRSDVYRVRSSASNSALLRELFLGESFKFIFWYRACRYTSGHPVLRVFAYPIARLLMRHYGYAFGIGIPPATEIGPGFYIGHHSGIFVHPRCRIGKNCNLSPGVVLGLANRGPRRGVPTLGDNVYLGPGVKVVGAVRVGDHVAVGANAVVTSDLPDHSVAVGIPAKVISLEGSAGYVMRTGYEDELGPWPGSEDASPATDPMQSTRAR